jgi:hypothetical protein
MERSTWLSAAKKFLDEFFVGDIALDEAIVGQRLHIMQVLEVAGIGERVHVDDRIVGILRGEKPDDMGPDESSPSGDQYLLLHNELD